MSEEKSMSIRMVLSVAAIASAFIPVVVFAGQTHKVSQAGKLFTPAEIEITHGDTVGFVNDDAITHNVFAKSMNLNTGAMKPGDSKEVTFDVPGKVEVKCAIHPMMKMTITVK
jgi:plastocyanin